MTARERVALDRHITGSYGEDSVAEDDYTENAICPQCSGSGLGMSQDNDTTCRRCGGSGNHLHPWGRALARHEAEDRFHQDEE